MDQAAARLAPPGRLYPGDIDWGAAIPERPLTALLDEAVARFPDRPCAEFLGRRFSYRQIGELADRFAGGLAAAGIRPGDRVALLLPNCPWFIVAFFGILKSGAAVVNLNPLYTDRELAHQVADSGAAAIVTLDLAALYGKASKLLESGPERRLIVATLSEQLPRAKGLVFPLLKRREIARVPRDARHLRFADLLKSPVPAPVPLAPSDLAVLQYTGGTTGVPKAAMLTHGALYANTQQSRMWFTGTTPGRERMMAVLPFFHVFAMTVVMNLSIAVAAEMVILPRFELAALMRAIDRHKPTFFPAVPTIYTAINNHPERDRYDLSSIRMCVSGGAPLPVEVKETFERVTGCSLVEGYGLTEASPVVACNPLAGLNKTGAVGLPLPGTTVEIVSLEDGVTVLPTGEIGEICVRGPQLMAGYWNRPAETAAVLRNGRLHTGDIGRIDEDGYVFVVDRIKDVIIASGFKVYPRDVEEQIYQHPGIAECIVAGVPDAYRGQSVKAYVVRRAGSTVAEEELRDFLRDRLSPIAMPRQFEFRETLPRTMIGKLSRKDVLAEEEARRRQG